MNPGLMNILAAGNSPEVGSWAIVARLPLLALVMLPFAAAVVTSLIPTFVTDAAAKRKVARSLALGISLIVFALSLWAASQFNWADGGAMQLSTHADWIGLLGVHLGLGVDALSLWLVLLTAFLMPVTILGTWNDGGGRAVEFYVWLLVLLGALVGVFCATDLILFYTFFELTLVPLYFLIGIFGSGQRHYASLKFFLFTLAGSAFTLVGILYVAWFNAQHTGLWTFYIPQLIEAGKAMSATQQGWVLAALLSGFAVKVPLFPVHTWLPLAHTEAPTAGSVILAGVLLKLGSYGILRFAVPMVPQAFVHYAPIIAGFCIVGILYAALVCWVQSDLKKLVAYSSVSHMGFCILGIAALNTIGFDGSIIYMLNHGISTGALFLCVGMMYNRYHTREMDNLSGLGRRMPIWGTFFVFFTFASVGLPGLNGFVGEFLTIFGTFTSGHILGPAYAGVAALGLITGAIYLLYMLGRVVFGPLKEPAEFAAAIADHGHGSGSHGHAGGEAGGDHAHKVSDLAFHEIAALVPLALACLVIGLYPTPILKSVEPAIHKIAGPAQAYLPHDPIPTPTATAGLTLEQGPRLAVKLAATEVAR